MMGQSSQFRKPNGEKSDLHNRRVYKILTPVRTTLVFLPSDDNPFTGNSLIMEEYEGGKSQISPENSISPDPPIGAKTEITTKLSDSSPSNRNGLELVISPRNQSVTGGRRSGGGRDDCWSEEATEILINAWGERFMELKRGNLKQQHWKQVAEIVNNSNCTKSAKTDIQCKNRIDTVKKKFKQEKAKIDSNWLFFNKLQHLIGEGTVSKALVVTPLSSRVSLYQRKAKIKEQGVLKRSGDDDDGSTRWRFGKRVASETESEDDVSVDSGEDSLPPMKRRGGGEVEGVVMAIVGFAERFEKVESLKIEQMVEMEKERIKFAKEVQLQRMEFIKDQLEIFRDGESRIKSHHKSNGNVS